LEGQRYSFLDLTPNSQLHHLNFKDVYNWKQFFSRPEEAELYEHYAESIGSFFNFPRRLNGLIANIILFHASPEVERALLDPIRVRQYHSHAKDLLRDEILSTKETDFIKLTLKNLDPFIGKLDRMGDILKLNEPTYPADEFYYEKQRHLTIINEVNSTLVEDHWLKDKLNKVSE